MVWTLGRRGLGAALAVGALMLAGCGSSWNQGGDTTCGTFKGLKSDQQSTVIQTFLKDKGQDASNLKITLTKASAKLYCATAAKDSDLIKRIDG
jgi:acid stress chaperone HdeA